MAEAGNPGEQPGVRRHRLERVVDQQPAHPPGGEQLQPLGIFGALDLGLRPPGEIGVQPLGRGVQLVAQPPDRTAERVELVERTALEPAGVGLGEAPLAQGRGAEEVVVVRMDHQQVRRYPGQGRRRHEIGLDRVHWIERPQEPELRRGVDRDQQRAAGNPRAAGDPQGDRQGGEDDQRQEGEAGPAQALVGDERRRTRDEEVEPGFRRPSREAEEAPETRERQRQRDEEPAEEPPGLLVAAQPLEPQPAEERRADRHRQPELDRIAERLRVHEEPRGHRVEPAQREEDAEGDPAPGPVRPPVTGEAGDRDQHQRQEPGVEGEIVGGDAGEELRPPEGALVDHVRPAEQEGDQPLGGLPRVPARHGDGLRAVAHVAAQRDREDAQELDDLRQGDQRAAEDRGAEQGGNAPPRARRPLLPGQGHGGGGQQQGEGGRLRVAAQDQQRPEQGDPRRQPGAPFGEADEVEAGGHQRWRQAHSGDQVVEVEVGEEEAGDRPADRRRPGSLAPQAPGAGHPVERERRQEQVEPEVGVERPEGGAQEDQQVVRIERRGVEVARQRLPPGPVGVDDREVPLPHSLGLRPLHGEVGVEHVAQDQGLRAAHQRQHGDEKQDQERAGVEEGRAPARGLGVGQDRRFGR